MSMKAKTVLNAEYRGLVKSVSIPAELHERDGRKYASFGTAVPVHCCTKEQVLEFSKTTHHYADIFITDQTLAPLGEAAYVRLDENNAEKVFINRTERILVISSDGLLAQWRCAPTFESANRYLAGTPLVNAAGELLSLVTARRGNHYAISNIEGGGGYFETTESWSVIDVPAGHLIYGARTFPSREALRDHVACLPSRVSLGAPTAFRPAVVLGAAPRIVLVAENGRQIAHNILHGVAATDIEYL